MDYKFETKTKTNDVKPKYKNTWRVNSEQPLKQVNLPNHKGWLVTDFDGKMIREGVWFDADFDGNEAATYSITKITDHVYDIEIESEQTDITFNSLGGLNYVNKTVTFALDEYVLSNTTYTSIVNETIEHSYNLTVYCKGCKIEPATSAPTLVKANFRTTDTALQYATQTSYELGTLWSNITFEINYSFPLALVNGSTKNVTWNYNALERGASGGVINTSTVLYKYYINNVSVKDIHVLENQIVSMNISALPVGVTTLLSFINYSVPYYDLEAAPHTFNPNTIYPLTSYQVNVTGVINVTNLGVSYLRTSTIHTFNITSLVFSECSTNTTDKTILLNLSIFDELLPAVPLTAEIFGFVSYFLTNSSQLINYSFNDVNKSSYLVCINNNVTQNFSVNAEFKYNVSNGYMHSYYLQNAILNNITKNISMFNFNNATGISDLRLDVRNESTFLTLKNVIVWLDKRYLAENVWRTVQMDRTGEFGSAAFNIIEKTAEYKLRFIDSLGRQIKETDIVKFACDIYGVCDRTILAYDYKDGSSSKNVQYTTNVNDVQNGITDILSISWVDTTGLTSNFRAVVTKETLGNTITICNVNTSAASGVLTCNVSGYSGTLGLKLYSSASPEESIVTVWINIVGETLQSLLGTTTANGKQEGALWGSFISIALISGGVAMGGGIGAIMMGVLAVIINGFLGLFSFGGAAITVIFIIMGVVVAMVVKR